MNTHRPPRDGEGGPPGVLAVWEGLVATHRPALVIGGRLYARAGDVLLARPEQLPSVAEPFQALLWTSEELPFPWLTSFHSALSPGAVLGFLVAPRRTARARVLALLKRPEASPPPVELCTALLVGGFVAPCVHACAGEALLVVARVPSPRDALDACFAQPDTAGAR